MANITRKQHKIFAALSANNGQFGSDQAGSPVTSNDPDVIQALPAYNNGWLNATVGASELPTLEDMQGLQYNNSYQTAYLLQKGIPEWNNLTDYHTGDIVRQIGGSRLYKSITDDNINNPIIDLSNWQYLGNLDNLFTTEAITTEGDLIRGSSAGQAERLAIGTANQILTSDGTNMTWSSNAQVNNLKINNKLNTQPNTATISSGAITYTNTYMVVDTEASASTDDLDTINGGSVGDILIIRQENDGRDITFKHAGGNINLTNGIEFSFVNTRDRLVLQYDGSFWVELSRSLDVEIRHSIDYDNGVSKSYNTIYQASEAGYLVIQLAGSFRNAAQLLVGSASPPTTQVGIWGDDINTNTKAVSACYPISKGTYYQLAPATVGAGSDAWETVDFKFYPIKRS